MAILGMLALTGAERNRAIDLIETALNAASPLLRTYAMQALWSLSSSDPELKSHVDATLSGWVVMGTAGERQRAARIPRSRDGKAEHFLNLPSPQWFFERFWVRLRTCIFGKARSWEGGCEFISSCLSMRLN